MIGVQEFLSTEFFNLIGSFQMSTGCFADIPVKKSAYLTKLNIAVEKPIERVLDELLKPGFGRSKRDDSVMRHGCSSHETGLAITYFSIFFQKTLNTIGNTIM
jgi:hypothetical protein